MDAFLFDIQLQYGVTDARNFLNQQFVIIKTSLCYYFLFVRLILYRSTGHFVLQCFFTLLVRLKPSPK